MKFISASQKKRLCERKRDHVYEAFKRNLKDKFHSALRQFGLLSFNWTILFETNSYKILASKEIEYIDKYRIESLRIEDDIMS